jgi:hypothetical protein
MQEETIPRFGLFPAEKLRGGKRCESCAQAQIASRFNPLTLILRGANFKGEAFHRGIPRETRVRNNSALKITVAK